MEFKDINKKSYYHDKTGMLLKGNCLEWMAKFPDKSVDMILCDLPYGTTQNKWDIIIPFDKLWKQYERIRKDDCTIVLFGSEPFSSYLRLSNIDNFRYDWIWHKSKPSGMALSKKQPMRNHETLSVFYQGKYNPIKEEREGFTASSIARFSSGENLGTYRNHGDSTTGLKKNELKTIEELRFPTTIKKFASVPNRLGTLHPTQKPTDLFEYLIKTYTSENEIVLDNTAGSCTTAIACKNTNRKWICIEQEQKYCDISIDRIKNYVMK